MTFNQLFRAIADDNNSIKAIKITIVATAIAVLVGTIMAFVSYWRYANNYQHCADKYIQELEECLEINGISIDDTVGSGDAYETYYMSLKGRGFE